MLLVALSRYLAAARYQIARARPRSQHYRGDLRAPEWTPSARSLSVAQCMRYGTRTRGGEAWAVSALISPSRSSLQLFVSTASAGTSGQ